MKTVILTRFVSHMTFNVKYLPDIDCKSQSWHWLPLNCSSSLHWKLLYSKPTNNIFSLATGLYLFCCSMCNTAKCIFTDFNTDRWSQQPVLEYCLNVYVPTYVPVLLWLGIRVSGTVIGSAKDRDTLLDTLSSLTKLTVVFDSTYSLIYYIKLLLEFEDKNRLHKNFICKLYVFNSIFW